MSVDGIDLPGHLDGCARYEAYEWKFNPMRRMNISISRDGTEIGEWTEEDVRALYAEGQLLPTDFYWKEGMSEWKELGTYIKPAPPAASPPPPNPTSPATAQVLQSSSGQKQKFKLGCIGKSISILVPVVIVLAACLWLSIPVLIHAVLAAGVADQNKNFPTTNSNGVRIESCSVSLDNTVHFHCTMTNIDDDAISSDALASNRQITVENFRADPKSPYLLFYFGVKYEYDLYNVNGNPLGDIVIGYDDIK
jgi:hypothetical protein